MTDFQHLKLGKLPAIRYHALGWAEDYLLGKPPQPAGKVVAPVPAGGWGMADNDTLGDCVEAGTDHAIKAMNALLGTHDYEPTDPEISEQYFHETGGSTPASSSPPTCSPGSGTVCSRRRTRLSGRRLTGSERSPPSRLIALSPSNGASTCLASPSWGYNARNRCRTSSGFPAVRSR